MWGQRGPRELPGAVASLGAATTDAVRRVELVAAMLCGLGQRLETTRAGIRFGGICFKNRGSRKHDEPLALAEAYEWAM